MTDTAPTGDRDRPRDEGLDGQRTLSGARLAEALRLLGDVDPACAEVIGTLNLRVYPAYPADDAITDYVVLDVHGVSIGVQRRTGELHLHADTSETDDDRLAFEINGGGEIDHPIR